MKHDRKRLAGWLLAAVLTAGVLPLRTGAEETHQRILNLHMGSAGTCYEIYFAADLLDALFGVVTISRDPGLEELERVQRADNLAASVTTDTDGNAVCNFTRAGLEDGVYLVTGENGTSFYVCVPAPDGDGWAYTVDVYPGYRIGGEAEPKPVAGGETAVRWDSANGAAWGFEGAALLASACWALLRQVLRMIRG